MPCDCTHGPILADGPVIRALGPVLGEGPDARWVD